MHPPGSSSSDDRNFDPRRRPVKSHHRSRSTRDENAKEDRQGRGHGAEPRAGGHRAPQRPSPNEFGVVDQGTRVYRPVFPDQRLQDPVPSGLVSADARHRPSTRSSRNLDDAQLLEARMRFARLRDDDGLVPARVGSPDSTRAAWGGSPEPATTRRRHRAFSFTAADQLARRRAARTSPYWLDPYANPWATSSEEEYQQGESECSVQVCMLGSKAFPGHNRSGGQRSPWWFSSLERRRHSHAGPSCRARSSGCPSASAYRPCSPPALPAWVPASVCRDRR